jgi:hypothetical protein
MYLVGAHGFFGCTERMEGEKPLVKRDIAVFEDRAYGHSELLAARAAFPHSLAIRDFAVFLWLASNRRKFGGFAYKSTVRATHFAVRPAFSASKNALALSINPRFRRKSLIQRVIKTFLTSSVTQR